MPAKLPLRPYALAWIPLYAVYVALYMAAGTAAPAAARGALVFLLPPALLGLLLLAVPGRVAWHDRRPSVFLAVQLGIAVAYVAAGTAGVMALWTLETFLTSGHAPVGLLPLNVARQAVITSLTYVAIVGVAYAWHSAQRVQLEAARAARAEALRAQAELAALRSQLNPHFLLNTLHAALGLVRHDPALAERALERLGEVLHYGLRMHRDACDEVPLAQEWAFVHSYLEIESLRLEERLRLSLDADPDAMDCLVPPFVVQPLVENAILHAVAPRRTGGRVGITARRLGDRLQLEVRDDGPGLPDSATAPGCGLGLQLLRDRLAMLYAGDARLTLLPVADGGLSARIDLPLRHAATTEPS